jgi:hypothetical protein
MFGRITYTALAVLMTVALSGTLSSAAPINQSLLNQTNDEFEQFFKTLLQKFKVPSLPTPIPLSTPEALGLPGVFGGAPADSIGIDYIPESRCSDNNWSTSNPTACNPQLSFTCTGNNPLSGCPSACQTCYNNDLVNLQTSLSVSTITSYQPNYYILTAANQLHIKVLQGLYNDAIPSLAASDSSTNCTFAGAPIALCGSKYAGALLDGACGTTTPWNPATFCVGGPYIEPLNYPSGPSGQFITDGTIIAIQLGNEALNQTVNGQVITAQMISTAAQTLRSALNARGFVNLTIVVSLVLGQESTFCSNGAPPAGINFIAAHPYCDSVASVPPSWPNNGTQCWQQVLAQFRTISQASCGATHTFIGETGYNTGCPNSPNVPSTTISDEQTFITNLKTSTCAIPSRSGFPTFLFAYSDVCPASGCAPGCSDAGLPNEGNGYFGIFHTQDYLTEGPAVSKFPPPSLVCP